MDKRRSAGSSTSRKLTGRSDSPIGFRPSVDSMKAKGKIRPPRDRQKEGDILPERYLGQKRQ